MEVCNLEVMQSKGDGRRGDLKEENQESWCQAAVSEKCFELTDHQSDIVL